MSDSTAARHGLADVGSSDGFAGSSLLARLTAHARPVSFAGESTVTLSDPSSALLVTHGDLDLFAVDLGQMLQSEALLHNRSRDVVGSSGKWTFVCRVPVGTLLAGAAGGSGLTLLGRPLPTTSVHRLPLTALTQLAVPPATWRPGPGPHESSTETASETQHVLDAFDAGLRSLSLALRSQLPPRDFVALDAQAPVSAEAGAVVRIVEQVGWLSVRRGSVSFGEETGLRRIQAGQTVFLTDADWVVADTDAELRFASSSQLLAEGLLWPLISSHSGRLLEAIGRRLARREAEEARQMAHRVEADRAVVDRAQQAMGRVLSRSRLGSSLAVVAADPPPLAAMRLVCGRLGIPVTPAHGSAEATGATDPIRAIAQASRVRTRTIWLQGAWWRTDFGPAVAYRVRDNSPVALIPVGGRRYRVLDPEAGTVERVNGELSTLLSPLATIVYRPLPPGVTRLRELLRLGLQGCRREIATFTLCAVFLALLGLAVPIVSGQVLGRFVPEGQRSLIVDACLVVIAGGLLAAAFGCVQNLVVLRLEGRASATVQAAVWDHLLALPVTFFSRYSVGELSLAAMAANTARDAVSGVATTTGLALLVGGANLVLMLVVSPSMGVAVIGLIAISLTVCAVAARAEIRQQRELFAAQQQLSSRVFQLLTGMTKLRVAAAEDRAFATWADDFTRSRRVNVRARQIQNYVNVFNAAFAVIGSLAVFALSATWAHLSTTAFLTFFSAYGLLLGSTLQFTGVVISVVAVAPVLDSLLPITSSEREVTLGKSDPGELSGAVTLRGLSFRYAPDGPMIIDDVSLNVRPGEFVAVVGPTGCGKSTLVRLLLGFSQPTSGSVLFDGKDLSGLDVTAVRRQCGVVLQNSALLAGDIKANIVGNSLFTEEDAWAAARLAGLATDIEEMPMGMYTAVSEGASTLSGGQRQRLMIARALVTKPRILILDEATSALDNPTQAKVAESTRQLHATRFVIAHRLSTVRGADRIVVLDKGRIAQQGKYEELLADEDGLFARLVRRQIA